jgi:hypothetical protein
VARQVKHIKATKSWWSGRITALCGWTREPGDYERVGWFSSLPVCPDCKRIEKKGRS